MGMVRMGWPTSVWYNRVRDAPRSSRFFMWALVKRYDEVEDFDNKASDDIADAIYDREDKILNYFVDSGQPMLQPSRSIPKSNTSEFSFTEFLIRSFFSLDWWRYMRKLTYFYRCPIKWHFTFSLAFFIISWIFHTSHYFLFILIHQFDKNSINQYWES